MSEFIRARSIEQKQLRMNEIMEITDYLFSEHTYHEITLTTIAESLNWSRGNLYKYVTTKEEIFLELYLQKQRKYFNDVKEAFFDKMNLTEEAFADLWTKTLDSDSDFLKYYSILATIIETNVSIERLVEFKKNVTIGVDEIINILQIYCAISYDKATNLLLTLLFHACGLYNSCNVNPFVRDAIKIAGIPEFRYDFTQNFCEFMLMCLKSNK